MTVVLGIDAAWTEKGSSGIAVLKTDGDRARVLATEASYEDLLRKCSVAYSGRVSAPELLAAAVALGGEQPAVVAIDMPVSRIPFQTRRSADNLISARYGSAKASTHSPTALRPGPLGARITAEFAGNGYPVALERDMPSKGLIEVYPHVALIALMRCAERRPYKVSRAHRYWPETNVPNRIERLLAEWTAIREALGRVLDLSGVLEPPGVYASLASMKAYEDRLDAVISGWVGLKYLRGEAVAFGDASAVIWVPK